MTFFNSKVKRFLAAMAGKDSIPDPESPIERLFEAICRRLDKFLLPTPGENDAGKVPVAKADGSYELSEVESGGSEVFEVYITDEGSGLSADKTWYDIYQAYLADKTVVFLFEYSDRTPATVQRAFATFEIGQTMNCIAYYHDASGVFSISINENNQITKADVGGSSPLVVTFSGTTADGDAACDKSVDEIEVAYNSGQEIVVIYDGDNQHIYMNPRINFGFGSSVVGLRGISTLNLVSSELTVISCNILRGFAQGSPDTIAVTTYTIPIQS